MRLLVLLLCLLMSVSADAIVFPSDYARQGEAAAAAGTVAESVQQLQVPLSPSQSTVDPSLPAWSDPWGATWSNLNGWDVPAHFAQCPSSSINVFGTVITLSSHCDLYEQTHSVLSMAMAAAWALYALLILLKA